MILIPDKSQRLSNLLFDAESAATTSRITNTGYRQKNRQLWIRRYLVNTMHKTIMFTNIGSGH
jgi:hypothetical protein